MISREAFFSAAKDVPRREVVLENGESVYVRGMTLGEAEKASSYRVKDQWAAYIVSVCTVDEDGNPFFEEGGNDIKAISELSCKFTQPIHEAALEMTGIKEEPAGNDDGQSETDSS